MSGYPGIYPGTARETWRETRCGHARERGTHVANVGYVCHACIAQSAAELFERGEERVCCTRCYQPRGLHTGPNESIEHFCCFFLGPPERFQEEERGAAERTCRATTPGPGSSSSPRSWRQRLMGWLARAVGLGLVVLLLAGAGGKRWAREWVREGPPLTKHLAIVVDVSGSMRGDPHALARREVATVLSLFADEGWVKVYAFDDEVEQMQEAWAELPDEDLARRIDAWLLARPGSGNTNLAAGIAAALAEPEEDLTVLLVSDGEPSGCEEAHLAWIGRAQAARDRVAPIHVIGVAEDEDGWEEGPRAFLRAIAKDSGGGLLLFSPAKAR